MNRCQWSTLKKAPQQDAFPIYFILGTQQFPQLEKAAQIEKFMAVLTEACQHGIRYFQFRDKDGSILTDIERLELAQKAQAICQQYNVIFFINDDVEMAIQLQADGLHIGQTDPQAQKVRDLIGDNMLLGVSAHTVEQVQQAIDDGADYVGCGPIFTTQSKVNVRPAIGPELFSQLQAVNPDFPVFAIGGIHLDNVAQVQQMNPDAICVISEISASNDIEMAIQQLSHSQTI